jgi:hypothetical protein
MYDHGLRYYQGRYLYVFGGINTTKLLNHVDARLGVGFVGDNYVC